MKRVIIIGGGYAGIGLAQKLDRKLQVQLIEPREAFVHNIGGLRAAVQPALLKKIVIPYDRLLKNGTVIRSRVTAINPHSVMLADGREIAGDVIVVATGSSHNMPFKPRGDSAAEFADSSRLTANKIEASNSIAIIGGGPVGVELAGEIREMYEDKPITLVSRAPQLCTGFNPKLGTTLQQQLEAKNISVILGTTPKKLPVSREPTGPINWTLSNEQSLAADLVFFATGASIDNRLLFTLNGTKFSGKNRAIVDPWWRLPNAPTVLAFGDAAESGAPMTAVALMRQIPHIAEVVLSMAEGRNPEWVKPYKPWPADPLFVPIGPKAGASILPIGKNGKLAGSGMTSLGKGSGLLINRYRKQLGYGRRS